MGLEGDIAAAGAGIARCKRSEGKATWPGIKQVCRRRDADGRLLFDRVQLATEPCVGETLLQPCMIGGRRAAASPTLEMARTHCAAELLDLPDGLRALGPPSEPYRVEISDALRALARAVDAASG